MGMDVILCSYALTSAENSKITVTEHHQEILSMEQWCDRNQPSIQINGFYSKCGAANCMNLRAAKKIKYGQRAWVTSVPTLLIFYSILCCSVHQP
jgi:hypothetical protein